MLFKRTEPQKRSSLCTLTITALTAIGAFTVVSTVKKKVECLREGMKKLFCTKKKAASCDTAFSDACPVYTEEEADTCCDD